MDMSFDRAAQQTNNSGSSSPQPCGAELCQKPIDLVHLARYTLGNRALELEILQLFQRQSEIDINRLATAQTDKAWLEAAHTIKGSARAVGAWHVGLLAEAAERLSGDALARHRGDTITKLAEEIGIAGRYIESLLAED